MKKRVETVTLNGQHYRVCWDMLAWDSLDRLSKESGNAAGAMTASGILDALWSAIDAAAADADMPCPVSRRKLGTMISDAETLRHVLGVLGELIVSFAPDTSEGKAPAAGETTAPASPSLGATNSPFTILESA